jgi:hypothetical protein
MIPYDESEVVAFALDITPLIPTDPGRVGVNCARMQYDACAGMGYPASRAKHLAELQAEVGVPPSQPLPPVPTRNQVCAVRCGFQGETVTTREYGTFPVFGPETTTLADDDLRSYCEQLRSRGWTHGQIAVSWQYAEPGFLMPVPGRDLSNDLPELARRIAIMLESFTAVIVFLAGDGRSAPKNPDGSYPYNDPVGHTYGCEWLMDNLPRIVDGLQHSAHGDLTPYCLFSPGYDGVFYGWGNSGEPDLQPQRVADFGALFRSLLPAGHLAIEHTPGKYPVGDGGADWDANGRMATFDVLLSEFNNWPEVGGDYWQIVARSVPVYHTPPDQAAAAADPNSPLHAAAVDPNPPYYLKWGSPRGPYFYVPFEYATYPWTRGRISAADVQTARQYFYNLGCANVC